MEHVRPSAASDVDENMGGRSARQWQAKTCGTCFMGMNYAIGPGCCLCCIAVVLGAVVLLERFLFLAPVDVLWRVNFTGPDGVDSAMALIKDQARFYSSEGWANNESACGKMPDPEREGSMACEHPPGKNELMQEFGCLDNQNNKKMPLSEIEKIVRRRKGAKRGSGRSPSLPRGPPCFLRGREEGSGTHDPRFEPRGERSQGGLQGDDRSDRRRT